MNFWDEDKLRILKEGVESGRTFQSIGDEIGSTKNAAIGKARRMGFKKPAMDTKISNIPKPKPKLKSKPKTKQLRKKPIKTSTHVAEAIAETTPESIEEAIVETGQVQTAENNIRILNHSSKKEYDGIERGCRAIFGDVGSGEWGFCQKPKKDGSSYCEEHHSQNYRPVEPRKKKSFGGFRRRRIT